MRPREKGGVVDASLKVTVSIFVYSLQLASIHPKVYGTRNVRVGDISIIPLHINAHTQSTFSIISPSRTTRSHLLYMCLASAYAIAEQCKLNLPILMFFLILTLHSGGPHQERHHQLSAQNISPLCILSSPRSEGALVFCYNFLLVLPIGYQLHAN